MYESIAHDTPFLGTWYCAKCCSFSSAVGVGDHSLSLSLSLPLSVEHRLIL